MSELEKLVFLHRANRLPEEVELVYVSVKRTAYGDWQIAEMYTVSQELMGMEYEEHIKIERYRFGNQNLFAGYGEKTKTLVIGKEMV